MTRSKRVVYWTSETWCECSDIAGSPQDSPPAVDYVGCEAGRRNWARDKAHLRWGRNDQSNRGHQCSVTSLTGESRFHISTPLGIEPGSLMTGSKRVVHWTSETLCESSEIACSPQYILILFGKTQFHFALSEYSLTSVSLAKAQ